MRRWNGVQLKWNRKIVTLCTVALLLVAAVVANFVINGTEQASPAQGQTAAGDAEGAEQAVSASTNQKTFFESFRSERDTTRAQEIAYLDMIVEQGADADTLADAQQQKLSIVDYMEKELTVESLLKAKGFSDAAVTIHKGSVNVILSSEALSEEQVAQVLDIVTRETGEGAENIKVTTAQ